MEEKALKMVGDRLLKQFGDEIGYRVTFILRDIYEKDWEQLRLDLTNFI